MPLYVSTCSTFKQELSNQFHFITFHLPVLTTVLDPKQAIPNCLAIHESMPPVGYPENTRPACTPGTSRTNPSPSCPGCPGPRPNLDSKPPLLSPKLSAMQGPPPSPPPISQSEKRRIHDKRATSLPCAHTQVCARDNKSVTCLDGLCNDRSLIDTDRENSVIKPCLASTTTQPLTPTNTQTISLSGHHFFFPPFIFFK